MWRLLFRAASSLPILAVGAGAIAQELSSAIRAPLACVAGQSGCTSDIDLKQIEESAQRVQSALSACLKETEAEKEKHKRENENRVFQIPPLIPFEQRCSAFAVESRVCDSEFPSATEMSWAPVELLKNGTEVSKEWRQQASNAVPVDGRLKVVASNGKPGEQRLASCEVRTVNGKHGPPVDCSTIAVTTGGRTWLRAEISTGPFFGCTAASSIRVSGAIDVSFDVRTKLEASMFSASIIRMLTEDLAFQSEQDIRRNDKGQITSIAIRSTAPYRDSPILKNGWREAIDFDLHIYAKGDGFDVSAFSRALVSRQASGQAIEYRSPDDVQRATYAKTLDDYVGQAIKRTCRAAKQVDSKRIECN